MGETTLKAEERLLTIPQACNVAVGVGGAVVDAEPMQLQALEMRNSEAPTWFEKHAAETKLGIGVAVSVLGFVKVAQNDWAAWSRPGV